MRPQEGRVRKVFLPLARSLQIVTDALASVGLGACSMVGTDTNPEWAVIRG